MCLTLLFPLAEVILAVWEPVAEQFEMLFGLAAQTLLLFFLLNLNCSLKTKKVKDIGLELFLLYTSKEDRFSFLSLLYVYSKYENSISIHLHVHI